MQEQFYKVFDANNVIKKCMPDIIETFVEYYGEENRELIERKLSNVLIFPYFPEDKLYGEISRYKKKVSEKVKKIFFDNANMEYSKELEEKIFSADLEYKTSLKIENYVKYLNLDDKKHANFFKTQAVNFLVEFYPEVTFDNLDELISNNAFSEIDRLVPLYEEALALYEKEKDNIKPFVEYIEKKMELKRNLKKKYYNELVSKFSYLFSEEELIEYSKGYIIPSKIKAYFGYNIDTSSSFDAFSDKFDKLLLRDKDYWRSKSIIEDRIKFFKEMGYNLGDNYEDYLNNPDCQKIINNKDLIEKINSAKKQLISDCENEFLSLYSKKNEMQELIDSFGLFLDYEIDNSIYNNGGTFISTNYKFDGKSLVEFPILFLELRIDCEYLDKNFIHELNHVLEFYLKSYDGTKIFSLCGFEEFGDLDNDKEKSDTKKNRKYEAFNEIINETIAQEITKKLHEKGIYIFNNKENAKDFGGTSYQVTGSLIYEFFSKYKNEIIASRIYGDKSIIFDKVGEENFNALNNLFYKFCECFQGYSFYEALNDKKNNRDTELSKAYDEIIGERDEILSRMEEYSLRNSTGIKR